MSKKIIPAEWSSQEALLLAWPHLSDEWGSEFEQAKAELADFIEACSSCFKCSSAVRLLAHPSDVAWLKIRFSHLRQLKVIAMEYWDIWLRDTAPVFFNAKQGVRFNFNGWGGKYLSVEDSALAAKIAEKLGTDCQNIDIVCEGGALEHNGEGLFVTTKDCLLSEKRNPGLDKLQVQEKFAEFFEVSKLHWIEKGLVNDHTDGHVDTLFRFGPDKKIFIMKELSSKDPNSEVLKSIRKYVEKNFGDYEVFHIPSPGKVLNSEGHVLPASYLNFLFLNGRLILPIYGSDSDEDAILAFSRALPTFEIKALFARAILSGGGAFHCISQQIPSQRGCHD